jgi:hypothetical protein
MQQPRSVLEWIKAPIPDVPEGKKPIRLIACGIPEGVDSMVNQLHILGFAETIEWTRRLNSPVPGEVIRILTRYIIITR